MRCPRPPPPSPGAAMMPWSPTWPPGLRVERRLVEDDLALLALVEVGRELPVLAGRPAPAPPRAGASRTRGTASRPSRGGPCTAGSPVTAPIFEAWRARSRWPSSSRSKPSRSTVELVVLGQLLQEVDGAGRRCRRGGRRPAPGMTAALARRAQLLDRLAELDHRLLEGGAEALLFRAHDARDGGRLRAQLRVGAGHAVHDHRDQLVQERLLDAELLPVAHRAPHDLAQHVAAAFVAGHHAVADQEGRRAQVVRHHAQGDVALRARAVGRARRAAPPPG